MKQKLLYLDTMITPKIITIIYWILLVGSVISGITYIFGGYEGFTIYKFFTGIVIIGLSAVGARIWCELLIVIFKINENLQNLKD
ncbi:MAG TPA: DUF4282 domain-containing protein [Brumimicrobium sp.]|nr:DUF4282 domain-containing protein [Brumimicrobium sp.]